jgi:Phage conserved hypothetical protein BR0599
MSFEDYEYSAADAKPVFLYLFTMDEQQWAYCTGDVPVTHAGVTYESTQIGDDGVKATGDATADSLKITAQSDLAVVQLFRGSPPGKEVFLDVRYLDASFITGSILVWSGSLIGVNFVSLDRAQLTCQSLVSSFGQYGNHSGWSIGCRHAVYSDGCNLDPADWALEVVITAKDGLTLTVPAVDAISGYTGGFIEWPVGGSTDRRTIEYQDDASLRILGGTDGIPLGAATVYFGCPRTLTWCNLVFDNSVHFSGAPGMPGISPFAGRLIF